MDQINSADEDHFKAMRQCLHLAMPFNAMPVNIRYSAVALSVLRALTGAMLCYHGFEMFDESIIDKYLGWEKIQRLPFPVAMVYAGKAMELLSGILLLLGWKTRIAAVFACMVMLFICFYVGNGIVWYDDQHPFLLAMIAAYIAVAGPGSIAIDHRNMPAS